MAAPKKITRGPAAKTGAHKTTKKEFELIDSLLAMEPRDYQVAMFGLNMELYFGCKAGRSWVASRQALKDAGENKRVIAQIDHLAAPPVPEVVEGNPLEVLEALLGNLSPMARKKLGVPKLRLVNE